MPRTVAIASVLSLALGVAAVPSAARQKPPEKGAGGTLFVNCSIHTGTGGKPIGDGHLLVKDGRIESVGAGKPESAGFAGSGRISSSSWR